MITTASIWLYFLAMFFAVAAGANIGDEKPHEFIFCAVMSVALFVTAAALQVIE